MSDMIQSNKKRRIWELDAFRGFCIICVIIIHIIFDLQVNYGILTNMPPIYTFIQQNGGILFVVLSGICVTLGSHHIKRGLLVAAGALGITFVTMFFPEEMQITFGVLHLLAFCMLTYGIYRNLHPAITLAIGIIIVAVGIWMTTFYVENEYLFVFGLITENYCAGDFFPIFPYLGYFMIGTFLGKTLYKKRETLFPKVNDRIVPIRILSWCGRQSFWIYLAHQPILYAIFTLLAMNH